MRTPALKFAGKTPRRHAEYDLQRVIVQHLRLRAADGVLWFHVPNGLKSDGRAVTRMKAIGLTPGVADLVIVVNGETHFLEMKAKGGRARDSQLAFCEWALASGCDYAIADTLDRALKILEAWGAIRPDALRRARAAA